MVKRSNSQLEQIYCELCHKIILRVRKRKYNLCSNCYQRIVQIKNYSKESYINGFLRILKFKENNYGRKTKI